MSIIDETLEQFTRRMEKVEKTGEYVIGRAYQGNSRAIFEFEGIHCCLESYGFGTRFPKHFTSLQRAMIVVSRPAPKERWSCSYLICGKRRAVRIARYYEADVHEDYYPREADKWFFLAWDTFEGLMAMVYDMHTGKFKELWGGEPEEYESCFGFGD